VDLRRAFSGDGGQMDYLLFAFMVRLDFSEVVGVCEVNAGSTSGRGGVGDGLPRRALAASAEGRAQLRRVAGAGLIGTAIEYYDFFLYGLAATVVFGPQFFPSVSPVAGTLASLATFGVGFLVRPLGGILFGHFGDRIGRKRVLVITLLLVGGSTFVLGLLPPYSAIGLAAPVLLVACRIVQGVGVGGEWGGAVLLAVEHAPLRRRSVYGAFPQLGNPIGLIASIVILLLCRVWTSPEQFQVWGWRIPFLLSAALVVTGLLVRLRVLESPEFELTRVQRRIPRVPFVNVLREYPRQLLFGALVSTMSPTVGLLLYVYLVTVGQEVLHLSSERMLLLAACSAVSLLLSIWICSYLSERLGRRRVCVFGLVAMSLWALPFFLLFESRSLPQMLLGFVVFGAAMGGMNGPQAAVLAELFPARVRNSGVSFSFQLASILGGTVAPLVAGTLLTETGQFFSVGAWVLVIGLVGVVSFRFLPRAAEDGAAHRRLSLCEARACEY
jgi:MFS family permease